MSDSNVLSFTNFDTTTLKDDSKLLKVFDGNDTEHLIHIEQVIDEHSIRVEEYLSEWTGSLDESGNVVAGNQLFVYGEELKKAIFTIATSALQVIDRQLQAEKEKVASLEARISALEKN